MKNVYGDKDTIKRAQEAPAGDKSVYINWQAIEELPEEYEAIVTEVKYDPKNLKASFSDVGNKTWMPAPDTNYKIADACGICGIGQPISAPIMEEVDINPMLIKPLDAQPTIRKMIVGRMVSKQSTILQEDGTLRTSSMCTSEYNAWERCVELWSKEEMYSKGYTEQQTYPSKYETMHKRKFHFDGEMKFAHAKAETKAHLKTIRELANLVTGYKEEDLKSGSLIFVKIRRSRALLKMETAARLTAMSRGLDAPAPQAQLFAPEPEVVQPVVKEEVFDFPSAKTPPVVPKSNREEYIDTIKFYTENNLIVEDKKEAVSQAVNWVQGNKDAESKADLWNKAVKILKEVEGNIPMEGRLQHRIY